MLKFYLIIIGLIVANSSIAQTILFSENFETANSSITLNTNDVNSTTVGYNEWIINNNFTGGSGSLTCLGFPFTYSVVNTPLQPNSFTNSPSSNYLHVISSEAISDNILASSFLAADGICFLDENYFVSMTNDISTTNHIGVEISFWWLCAGSINNFGEVYYSIDGGNSWVLLSNTGYQNQTSWMKTTIANPIFDNQSQLRFGFRFVNGITTTAADPAFSIDEIQIASTCANTSSNIIVSQCGPYTVPSGNTTHNASGFYTDTIPNSMGCDSIILIDLTINNNTSSSTNVSSCYTYTVPSGDETYTSNGMYLDTIPNTAGCDSIITINLTIKTVDTSLTLAGNLITANATGATYQWVDCLNAYSLIPGETNQSYTITVNGIYAVVITQNGCQDTSGCIRLDNVGLEENSLFNITTYPNPSDGYVYLNIPEHLPFLKFDLLNSYGAVIEKGKFLTNKSKFINLNSQSSGVYFIKIYNDLYSKTFKVILE